MPDQMKLPFALWTAQAVRALIHKKFGKTLGLSTMQLYLKRSGLTAQKPLTRATPRDPQRIAAWRAQDYPSIAARTKHEKAVIHWSDETDVRDQDQIGPFGKSSGGYAPQGQMPVLTQTRQTFLFCRDPYAKNGAYR
jgi:hypothetical protein